MQVKCDRCEGVFYPGETIWQDWHILCLGCLFRVCGRVRERVRSDYVICPVCNENISHYQPYEIVDGKRVHVDCVWK